MTSRLVATLKRTALFAATLTVLTVFVPHGAAAQDAYPSRPITIIVPYTPGGSADVLMRMVGQKMSESMKQPIVIDNRPGGAGAVGAVAVKNAPPDGYMLFMGHSGTHVFGPLLMSEMRYDPVKDFALITPIMSFASILVIPTSLPAASAKELVDYGRARPGGLSFASQGAGNTGHIMGEMFRAQAGIPMVHVPYKGAAPAVADTMTGRVDFLFSSYISARAAIDDKRLRMLAIGSEKRHPLLPDLPTMAEAGYPVDLTTWFGLMAPAGTPRPIVDRLNAEVAKAAATPEVQNLVVPQIADLIVRSPEEFATMITDHLAKVGKVVRDNNIKGE